MKLLNADFIPNGLRTYGKAVRLFRRCLWLSELLDYGISALTSQIIHLKTPIIDSISGCKLVGATIPIGYIPTTRR
jgi:hypothetical protein